MERSREEYLKIIYEGVSVEIDPEALQTKEFGQKTDGYKIGYLVEVLNNVLAPLGCSWSCTLLPITTEKGQVSASFLSYGSEKDEHFVVRLQFTIFDPNGITLLSNESFGGCKALNKSAGDGLKGAQTDALKKCFSYIGLGDTAFKGLGDLQGKKYKYQKANAYEAIKVALNETFGKELSDEAILRFCIKSCGIMFESFDDVSLYHLELTLDAAKEGLTKKKGKASEKKSSPREDLPKTEG